MQKELKDSGMSEEDILKKTQLLSRPARVEVFK